MTIITLKNITIYPIKSSAGIDISNAWVDELGLSFDRRFVITDKKGQFITARTDPTICLIQASLTANGLILSAPDMSILKINYADFSDTYQPANVWKDTINSQYCSKDCDAWFSQYLDKPCQLLYFGEQSQRYVKNSKNQTAFADGYPLLLISQASLVDLNQRVSIDLSMARFRPNIVVDNCAAFAEDTWQHIRIGEVEFEVNKPCSRCIFTTIDPQTAEKNSQQEPLKTLKSYRQVADGNVMFGQNLIPLNKGQIKCGDHLEILSMQTPPAFVFKKEITKKNKEKSTIIESNNIGQESTLKVSSASKFILFCREIIDETHDVKTFILQNSVKELISYKAGQHLPITATIDGNKISRCYTLSSSPTRNDFISITVKRVIDDGIKGIVSNYLHDHFTVGAALTASQPSGDFYFEESNNIDTTKILLLSAGSGITPMLSMLRAITDRRITNDIAFLHSAKTEKDLIAASEVESLAKQHGNCSINYTLTQSILPSWQDYQGHISKTILSNVADLTQRQVYVCGPSGFRDNVKSLLLALGLPEENYHYESFGSRHAQSEQQIKLNNKLNIVFDSWQKKISGNNKDTLLEQAEDNGIILPYSCRGGMCGSCIVKLKEGEVEQLADDGLTDAEKEQGYILACCCIPKTDLVISK